MPQIIIQTSNMIQMSQMHKYIQQSLTNHSLKLKFNHSNISHSSTTLKS